MKSFTAFVVAMICTFSLLLSQDFGQITPNTVSGNSTLRLLTIDNKPVIKATDGKRYLAKAKKTFEAYVGLKERSLSQTSHPTPDTPTNVYETIADATFAQIFGSLSNDLNKICLTQDQIEEFCLTHLDQLGADSYATFFLFKENSMFFVARVRVYSDGLRVHVYRLEYDFVWRSHYRLRVVVPQL